jgi:hypothetical protein
MAESSSHINGADCAAFWHVQTGRSRVQRLIASDGFRGEYPYAGVVVVAENCAPGEDGSASLAVETVRDVFAEGVAYGVEDALRDSFQEASDAIREKGLGGCSAAALAFSATHIWYALSGNCRLYRIDSDGVRCLVYDKSIATEMKLSSDHPDYLKKVREMNWWMGAESSGKPACGHSRIRKDTTYLLMTAGSWVQFEHARPILLRKGSRKTLQGWLTTLARDLKLAYRRQGGALAAVSGSEAKSSGNISWKWLTLVIGLLAIAGYLVLGNPFGEKSTSERADLFQEDSISNIVMPLHPDSADTTSSGSVFMGLMPDSASLSLHADTLPCILDHLPLAAAFIGDGGVSLPPDSFSVRINLNPDAQWENFSPGIYHIAGDTASGILAGILSERFPTLNWSS